MAALLIWFILMGVVAIIGSISLFLVKNYQVVSVLLVLMMVYSMVIAYFSATAQPTNFIVQKIVVWGIGIVAIVGTIIGFTGKKNLLASKSLVSGSVIFGVLGLFFM